MHGIHGGGGAPREPGGTFGNAHLPPGTRPRGVLKWMMARRRSGWPRRVDDPPTPPPGPVDPGALSVTFVGHSTFLVRMGGSSFLTDPVWSERASPVRFAGPRRVRAPGQAMEALPAVDTVLVSHCHYDHLDGATLRRAAALWHPASVTPTGNGPLLSSCGLGDPCELGWWETTNIGGLDVTCVPGQHFTARTPFDTNRRLWGGFVVRGGGWTVYFAGDTGHSPHMREIGLAFPGIDLALLPIGAYEPRWFLKPQHMDPAEAVAAHLELGAARSLGMHFGTFSGLTDESIDAPERDLAAAALAAGLPEGAFGTLAFGATATYPPKPAVAACRDGR